ncbi:MAG: cache domain-containing protein [Ideonella sp.]|nr:cache domain-containing protein [Ideonella sp.]MCC7458756.1 cache domain-containing protein [Nitrospira sp.]
MTGLRSALSMRRKLLALGLLPLLLALPLLAGVLLVWGNSAFDTLLITKVRSDLGVAKGYFDRLQAEVGASTLAVARSHALADALARNDQTALAQMLAHAKREHALEFLSLLPPDPTAIAAIDHASREGLARVELLENAQFERIAPELLGRVGVNLLPTPDAAPDSTAVEDRAMVVVAMAPVLALDGRPLGLLRGGVLLNRNLELIDHLEGIVYPAGSLPFGSQGAVTVLLDDVRVATDVRLFGLEGAQRAIGTRVSQVVRDAVLGRGQTWLDRAFVVNDWYVSAYQPLTNATGRRVGMLHVGYLERPFRRVKFNMLLGVGGVVLVLMALAMALALRWARRIGTPIERMAATMQAVQAGDLTARAQVGDSGDEVGRLAVELDRLLETLGTRTQALQHSHDELDRRLAERTRDLASAQAQLIRSERLAAIGQLAAGIAHDVQQPIAAIQGKLDRLRDALGKKAKPAHAELKLIDEPLARMQRVVTRLLRLARPDDADGVEAVAPAQALDDSLVLLQHQLGSAQIVVVREDGATRRVTVNRQALQQVLIHGIVNAIQAMPGGGTLTLVSRDAGDAEVEIDIADTGTGFPQELLTGGFRAFATTKPDGSGLGLWISSSLLQRHGGDLRARNRDDSPGAQLTIVLPAETPASDPAPTA